jgi:hypothetical protein
MVEDFYRDINSTDDVDMYLNSYDQNIGMAMAIDKGNEICFNCKEYLLINSNKYRFDLNEWWDSR